MSRHTAPFSFRRKRGEQNQAIGRSRGGRNTKIHPIADAKGRLLSLALTEGVTHDCPIAKDLIDRAKLAERLLDVKAYDSTDLRGRSLRRGSKTVIRNFLASVLLAATVVWWV